MKPWIIALAMVGIVACSCSKPSSTSTTKESPETKSAVASEPAEVKTLASPPAEGSVIFQGLIAYVESSDGNGDANVEALFVNALPKDQGSSEAHGSAMGALAQPPRVLSRAEVNTRGMSLPPHEPFVAVENGKISGENCFVNQEVSVDLVLDWEGESGLKLIGNPLCVSPPCGRMQLSLGASGFKSDAIDLTRLVDASDFDGYHCQDGFMQVDSNIEDKLAAQVTVRHGSSIAAKVLSCTATYTANSLQGNRETQCNEEAVGRKFAEQVEVYGDPPFTLTQADRSCVFAPDGSGSPIKVWFFNIHAPSYRSENLSTHHEAFYWYYNLASTPCTGSGAEAVYPRLCPSSGEVCLGDPKCPKVKLTRAPGAK